MKRAAVILVSMALLAAAPSAARADAGVIVPSNIKDTPDPAILSLGLMRVDVRAAGSYARVRVLQIFHNHIEQDIEGKYLFTVPDGAQISDFAIWEDGVRIPGVIVERRRAREIYEELTYMKIDPGLVETTSEEMRNVFSVEIYPIPAYGTKRVELEYTAELTVTSLRSFFSFPLKPTIYGEQSCDDFGLSVSLDSQFPISNFSQVGQAMPLRFSEQNATRVRAGYEGTKVSFTEDIAFEFEVDIEESFLGFSTYRNTDEVVDIGPLDGGASYVDSDGYFAASVVYNLRPGAERSSRPRDVVLLVDTSLSMQWDKLESSYEALQHFLASLSEADRFNLVTFNQEVSTFRAELVPASQSSVAAAIDFFRSGYLMGGTDLLAALEASLGCFGQADAGRDRYVIVITDGAPTLRELRYATIAERISRANSDSEAPIKYMIFGIGSDTNTALLDRLADDSGGHFIWASETEELEFKLRTFFDKLGESVIGAISLSLSDMDNLSRVYPAGQLRSYDRSMITFIGRYAEPRASQDVSVSGSSSEGPVEVSGRTSLPERATENDMLPRRWARLRVNYLLDRIDMAAEGEDTEEMIAEVVALAKRYTFVTPYTSFLAAPRALLRPRAIRPGDPVLRVRTDPAITAVVAVFPFGLTKPLHYITDEDIWEARFLAPKWMRDGTYNCTLLLTDQEGNFYREEKDFVIDSRPPTVRVRADQERYLPGQTITVTISADRDTRSLKVRLGRLLPVDARYRTALGASRAEVRIPPGMPAGTYTMRVTAVDFARNSTVVEIPVEIDAR